MPGNIRMIRNQYQSAPTRTASINATTVRMPKPPKRRLNSDRIVCKAPLPGKGRARPETTTILAPALDDPDQAPPVEPHLGHRQAVPQQHGHHVREPCPQL